MTYKVSEELNYFIGKWQMMGVLKMKARVQWWFMLQSFGAAQIWGGKPAEAMLLSLAKNAYSLPLKE